MISTNINVRIEVFPRNAGIESGRLFNDWLNCRFDIAPATATRGFHWTVHYHATDTASDAGGYPARTTFDGFAGSRREAHRTLIDRTTRLISTVVEARKHYIRRRLADDRLSADAGIPLAHVPLLPTGGLDPESPTAIRYPLSTHPSVNATR